MLMTTCNEEVRECLRQLDILVDNRELDLKKQLADVYKHFKAITRQCHQQATTVKEKSKQVATLQNELDRLTEAKRYEEEKNATNVSNLRSTFKQLNTMYEQLRRTFKQELIRTEQGVSTADIRMAERKQQILDLSEKLEVCNDRLKTVQKKEAALKKEFKLLKAECKELQKTQKILVTTEEKLRQRMQECEQVQDNAEMEILKLTRDEEDHAAKLESLKQEIGELQNLVADIKNKIQVKDSVIEPLLQKLAPYRGSGMEKMQAISEKINSLQSQNNQLTQDLAKYKDQTNEYLKLETQIKELQKEQKSLKKKQSSQEHEWEKQDNEMEMEVTNFRKNMIKKLKNVWKEKAREYDEQIAEIEANLKEEEQKTKNKITCFEEKIGATHCLHDNLYDQIKAFQLPYGGVLMTEHEDELRKLIQHIEIRVKAREDTLKAQLTKIYRHLEMKVQECQQQQTIIEDSSNKILLLREKINHIIERKQKTDINYDERLDKFMSQRLLTTIKRLKSKFQASKTKQREDEEDIRELVDLVRIQDNELM
ncbi:Hypothetical predicted protein [Octopus vulgaris]|uniref:Uncharacterized protein n=1 Tax=Octopus vulgaris TaxID=6645 RepID=A0AA36BT09_OCTVU|nr:Hypothetical predicted protein [Octopus vulgaris]